MTPTVHALDYDHRTEDLAFWRGLLPAEGAVFEVACGTGRIPRGLGWPCPWEGMDLDPTAVAVFNAAAPAGSGAVVGAMEGLVRSRARRVGLAICPFSSLTLVPHDAHAVVVANLAAVVSPGGRVAVEVFVPQPWARETAVRTEYRVLPADVIRRTVYRPHPDARVTLAERTYLRFGESMPLCSTIERIHWREPDEVGRILRDADLIEVEPLDAIPGTVVWTGVRP